MEQRIININDNIENYSDLLKLDNRETIVNAITSILYQEEIKARDKKVKEQSTTLELNPDYNRLKEIILQIDMLEEEKETVFFESKINKKIYKLKEEAIELYKKATGKVPRSTYVKGILDDLSSHLDPYIPYVSVDNNVVEAILLQSKTDWRKKSFREMLELVRTEYYGKEN
jgi:hypothetical protein